jgi:hypothetical protein
MPKPFSILLIGAVLLQSLFGAVAGAGTICLGGGHEHPEEAATASCELDCSHATGSTSLPSPVGEAHADCSCIDIDLSVSELLSSVPRSDNTSVPALLPGSTELPLIDQLDWQPKRYLPPTPSWFDPGGTQRVSHLSTTRLIV